jgi:hypothetical protein
MFTEVLRVIPKLDEGRTKAAEMSLSRRFGRVATRFGQGLRNVVRASVVGATLAFVTKLLNPLQAMHDKIKKLFGETDDIRETAARLGTTPGELLFHQTRAEALGVKPEQFSSLLESFRKSVDQRQQEVDEGKRSQVGEDPLLIQSDRLKGFQRALALIEHFSTVDPSRSRAFQRELFGETLAGNQLRLMEPITNVPLLGSPFDAAQRAQNATESLASKADAFRMVTAVQNFEDRLRSSQAVTGAITAGILGSQQRELDKDFSQMRRIETLQNASQVLGGILESLNFIRDQIFNLLAWLQENGAWFRNFIEWVKPFVSSLRGKK